MEKSDSVQGSQDSVICGPEGDAGVGEIKGIFPMSGNCGCMGLTHWLPNS